TKVPQGMQTQVFDGTRAWAGDASGVRDLPDRDARDMALSLRRDAIAVLLAADRGEVHPRLLPDVKDASGTLHRALERSRPTLDPVVFYVEPGTGLITRQTYIAAAPGQPLVEEIFSDYRAVDGVQIAFTAEMRRGGQPVVARHVTAFAINPSL